MGMPFSPCEISDAAGQCSDVSVNHLKAVFGGVIDSLVLGTDANSVAASSNILATMFSFFNSGLLIVASMLVSYVAIVGVTNTANDGEAMGKQWSTVWTTLRLVSGAAVLLPTASGYSIIQIIVLMITLWGVGFANGIYKAGVSIGILSPNAIVGGINKSGEYYGLRDFANNYISVAYCTHVANNIFKDNTSTPNVGQEQINNINGDISFVYRDSNAATNLGGGLPFCGSVTLTHYKAVSKTSASDQILESLHETLQSNKQQVAQQVMNSINAWVSTWPVTLNDEGWSQVDANKLNEIVIQAENQIATDASGQGEAGGNQLSRTMDMYVETIVKNGWAESAAWFQKVGAIRGAIAGVMSAQVGKVSSPSFVAMPVDARTTQLVSSVNTVAERIIKSAESKDAYSNKVAVPQDIANAIPKSVDSIDIGSLQKDMDDKMSSFTNGVMRTVIDTAIDAGGNSKSLACGTAGQMGGSVNRMKCIGDYLSIMSGSVQTSIYILETATTSVRILSGAASSVKIMGIGVDTDKVTTPLWDWVIAVPVAQLTSILRFLTPMAMYFSVLLPAMPNTIFMIVYAGWTLAVLQTVIAVCLWAMMHMTPERSFIGSQTQGYLLLLALFVRPALAVIGLFAAILVIDPMIDFTAQAFLDTQAAIGTSTGVIGSISQFFSFGWWMMLFSMVLLPIMYMCFSLPQILPDHVLKWINIGISDLGETSASSNMRGGFERIGREGMLPSNSPLARIGSRGGLERSGGGGTDNRLEKPVRDEHIASSEVIPPYSPNSPDTGSGGSRGGLGGAGRGSESPSSTVAGNAADTRNANSREDTSRYSKDDTFYQSETPNSGSGEY
ncbi:DotA/TraY family protein [Yersinia pseudotuberculosis]|uniref:DotA/TraY family protein n=1 Tax=Yersinia pseudotuberculosis TaxID=633 RepID=UPI0005DC8087|nr:DotA/TraY family protein [Yersinia pseudotuberculosis]CND59982.1 type IV secretion system protein DotA-like protein [Yersinia pseudotuberculosis]